MTPSRTTRFIAWLTLASFLSSNVSAATVDIASVPLVSMSTKIVRPNVMFVLDDSGSMNFDFMPDSIANPNYGAGFWSWLDDAAVAGNACMRNFGYNRLFYNPNITYDPPKDSAGNNMANANVTGAWDNGFASTGGPRNLQATTTVTNTVYGANLALVSTSFVTQTAAPANRVTVTRALHGLTPGMIVRFVGTPTSGNLRGINWNTITWTAGNPLTWVVETTPTVNTFTFRAASNASSIGNGGQNGSSVSTVTTTSTTTQDYYYQSFTANPASPPSTCAANGSYTQVAVNSMTSAQQQNFANWYSYYRNRIMMMKSSAGRAFAGIDDKFRVGFTTINETGTTAARWLGNSKFDAAQKSSWYTKLYAITPNGGTPLRGALSKAGRYYAGTFITGNADPVQYSCQKNFTILTTDGYWNTGSETATYGPKKEDNSTNVGDQDSNLTTSPRPMYESGAYTNTLADIARYYWKTDLRTTATQGGLRDDATRTAVSANIKDSAGNDLPDGHQHMNTITLGLGMAGQLAFPGDLPGLRDGSKNWPDPQTGSSGNTAPGIQTRLDDLWHAALNGGGMYASASDPEDVVDSLRAALATIVDQERSGAAAATSSLEPVTGDNFAYIAQYTTARWTGDIESHNIDLTNGNILTATNWSAAERLQGSVGTSTDTRTIYTANSAGTSIVPFTLANLNASDFGSTTLSQYATWNANQKANATADAMVKFIRGQHAYEMRNDATHTAIDNRLWRVRARLNNETYTNDVLGDIIDTSPVYVKKPPFRYSDAGYASYVGSQTTRAGTVYAGANDGMLHAFDSVTGDERWAYIPKMLHSQLYRLADTNYAQNHRYFVDGVITVGDVFDGSNWRTILVAGLGAGGKGYFALDVTDPSTPSLLWEFTDSNLGNTFGNPVITKRNSDGAWVVLFASGYNNTAGDSQGRLFMLDAVTGSNLGSVVTGAGNDPNLSGLSKITNWVLDTMVDNTTQYVYGGDLAGNLWRFDIDAMSVQKLGQTSGTAGAIPITARPEVSRIRDSVGTYHRVVYIGTGRYMGANDVSGASTPETTQQLLLAVKDTGTDLGTLTAAAALLVQQTVNTAVTPRTIPSPQPVNWASKNGWYLRVPLGERVTIEPRLQLGTVSFVANKPVDDYCALGGSSWLYALDYKSGTAITTQANNVVGLPVATNTIGTGLTIVRLPNGLLIAIINTPDGTRTVQLPIDAAGAGAVRRVGYREIN